MEYRILGPLEARHEGNALELKGMRQQTVLALLLVDANRVVPTDRLVTGVWNDHPPATSRSQIHICISSLRRQLAGGGPVDTRAPGYRLRVADGELDLHAFDAKVADGHAAVADRQPHRAVGEFRAALSLWTGAALAGITSRLVHGVAAGLNDKRLAVQEKCLATELEYGIGAPHELVTELSALVAAHPRRERLLHLLMTALYRAGRQAEALEAYRRARAKFIGELGLEPGVELQGLYQRILAHDPALSRPAPVVTRERGPRRLPADIVDFTGRDRSLAALLAPAPTDGTAVPTAVISGQGGIGKTTLAVHAAHRLAPQFPDGQLFARLSVDGVPEDPHAVLGRFLRAYGVDLPETTDERAETFRDQMAHRRVLIVLDGAVSESQVFPLLPGSARCRVIVTSRTLLAGLSATTRVRLTPFREESAVALLTRIAGADRIGADPAAVTALTEVCGNLPLAVRLAAARLAAHPHWTVPDLLGRFGTWSDELVSQTGLPGVCSGLSEPASRLLRLLPLVGGVDFAPWVAAPLLDLSVGSAEGVLGELVDAELVYARSGGYGVRFWMPGWIREYAAQLALDDEERHKALERLLGALLYLAEHAHRRHGGHDLRLAGNGASRWELPAGLVAATVADCVGWYRVESSWVLSAVRQATGAGLAEHAWGLAMCTVTFSTSGSIV